MYKAKELTNNKLKIFSSSWVAPPWMYIGGEITSGPLKESMYQVWADYHMKFIEAYRKEKLQLWGITAANQPVVSRYYTLNVPLVMWESDEMVSI